MDFPILRIPKSSSTGKFEKYPLALGNPVNRLIGKRRPVTQSGISFHAGGAPFSSTRRIFHPVEGGRGNSENLFFRRADFEHLPQTSPELPGSPGIRKEFFTPENNRRIRFCHFHRDRPNPAGKCGDRKTVFARTCTDSTHGDVHDIE